jgi:hypothetical protein
MNQTTPALSRYTPPVRKRDAVTELRTAIAEAEGRGVKRKAMLLHLTHSDASLLKRSNEVAQNEISFDGGMTFLGVKVEIGEVTVSALTAPKPTAKAAAKAAALTEANA